MTWWFELPAMAFLLDCGLHASRLVLRLGDRADEATGATMAAGTAALMSPLRPPIPDVVWLAVFLLWAACAVARMRAGAEWQDRGVKLAGPAAMVYLLLLAHLPAEATLVFIATFAVYVYFWAHGMRCIEHLTDPDATAELMAGANGPGRRFTRVRRMALRAPVDFAHSVILVFMLLASIQLRHGGLPW
jgi:hypothetical protein